MATALPCAMVPAVTNENPSSSSKANRFVLGRVRFEQISAVDGIKKSAESRRMFEEFDREGLTPEQRRKAVFEKYARKA